MRTAYKCRAYPDPEQAAQLSRTFGCVRLVWNKTLDQRHRRYHTEGKKTSYTETDAQLAAWTHIAREISRNGCATRRESHVRMRSVMCSTDARYPVEVVECPTENRLRPAPAEGRREYRRDHGVQRN